MKVSVNITFADQSSEKELASIGITRQELIDLYTQAFKAIVRSAIQDPVTAEVLVCVTDNTEEGPQ